MKYEEIYNIVRAVCGVLLLTSMLVIPACEDTRVEEQPEENI